MHDRSILCDELVKGWEGGTSFHDKLDTPSSLPFSVQILTSHASERNFIRRADHLEDFFNQRMVDGKRVVANMLLKVFQEILVRNFDTLFKNNDIEWPKRKSKKQSNEQHDC